MTIHEISKCIISAEREAGALLLQARRILAEEKSSHRDVVTAYDRRVQDLLMQRFRDLLPDACFLCEENAVHDDPMAEHLFIIDPIDGTMNFLKHLNHSAISVAYRSHGELLIGVVYNPFVDELFTAIRGKGAFLNGTPIHTDTSPLTDTVVCCGTAPYWPELADRSFQLMRTVFDNCLDIRRQGTASLDLCSIAAGRAGAYFELNLSPWDYAAGALIVEEAGGICTAFDGSPLPYDGSKSGLLAGSPLAWQQFRDLTV
jgi:myo-inositol-1(or 4)-monophosphatase